MRRLTSFQLSLIAFCAALNAGIGFLVQLLKLPIYLDLIGSVLAVIILGPLEGVAAAILGVLILGFTTVPTAFAYVGTAIGVTLLAYWFLRFGFLREWPQTIAFGALLGVASATMSAPVTVYLFGGVSFVGADAITAIVKVTGQSMLTSVFLAGLATDVIDKVLLSIICMIILRRLPSRLTARITSTRV